jgi:hypothetical protein
VRKQYNLWPWPTADGVTDAWDLDRLVELSRDLPVKALVLGHETISAVQFDVQPEPDFRNCRPEDLSYDETSN